jgi:hypothetical protein
MIVAAGACYETRRYPNSYNYVRLDPAADGGAGRGTVYLRRYSDQRGGFWARDTLTYRNAPDGVFQFPLPAGLRPPPSSEGTSEVRPGISSAAPDIHLETAGGAVHGDVRVEGGSFVGRDQINIYHLHGDAPQPSGTRPEDPAPPETYNIATIRSLLRDAFTGRELRRFCQDRPPFRPVLGQIGSQASLEDTIDAVITFCEKRLLFAELLSGVEEVNPSQYRRYAGQLAGSD